MKKITSEEVLQKYNKMMETKNEIDIKEYIYTALEYKIMQETGGEISKDIEQALKYLRENTKIEKV